MSYTAAMTITHQTVLGEDGEPTAAIIPWEMFVRINKQLGDIHGDEASDDEAEAIAEAEIDREAGNDDAFTDLADLRAEFAK